MGVGKGVKVAVGGNQTMVGDGVAEVVGVSAVGVGGRGVTGRQDARKHASRAHEASSRLPSPLEIEKTLFVFSRLLRVS